ncbi:Valacyclovir hydrolase [Fragariocoptes setiger]|uniref:Valacyclovir hydrolase n=1 Tax=Fragariocoptes setiger TaxID=1670756 RepID=A0ABQ7S6P6_9ACAR|nr:Valacyclovir hydrolase [Fragariocoptes setiger]
MVLLLIPGAIGCTVSDFPDQLNGGLDTNKFTIIAIDLPGYGKSRPPERMYSVESYPNDARKAGMLMAKLGYHLYSVLGWSDGAKIALLLAIENQARVEKLVVWGVVPYCSAHDLTAVSRTRDTSIFDPKSRELYVKAYGEELFEQLWHKHVDYCVSFTGNAVAIWDIRDRMKTIKCPTLILHGDKDPLIDKEHPGTAERLIPDSRLVRFANGSHNIHQTYAKEFNKIVTDFLLE